MSWYTKYMEKLNEEGRKNDELYKNACRGNEQSKVELYNRGGDAIGKWLLYTLGFLLLFGLIGALILIWLVFI